MVPFPKNRKNLPAEIIHSPSVHFSKFLEGCEAGWCGASRAGRGGAGGTLFYKLKKMSAEND